MSLRTLLAAAALVAAPVSALYPQVRTAQDSVFRPNTGVTVTGANQALPRGSDVAADSAFVRQAIASNYLEVRLGQLAQPRAQNSAVKQFAQRMVTYHTTMGNQWTALATRNGLPSKASLDANQQQAARQIELVTGPDFDRTYMTVMIQNHQQDLDALQRLGPSAHSADVRQLASSGVATIQLHLTIAQKIGSQVGVTTNVATVPQNPTSATTLPGTVQPKPTTAPAGRAANDVRADQKFVNEMAEDHLMEVRLAEVAQRKSKTSEVKHLADQMASDFSKWQGRWTDVASKNGIQSPTNLGPKHREKVDRVQSASGKDVDRTYLATVVEHLESMVPYFQDEGRALRSAQARSLVNDELPVVQQHLAAARRLQGQLNTRASAK